jgi:hypothetical protein
MHNLGWGCFELTGSIDAYLLYKAALTHKKQADDEPGENEQEELGES